MFVEYENLGAMSRVAQTAPSKRPKLVSIQILRGLAVIPVMWAHLVLWDPVNSGASSKVHVAFSRFLGDPLRLFQDGAHFGVLLSFVISGYVISMASLRETVWQFTVKRVLRIFPVLLLALCVVFVVHSLLQMWGRPDVWWSPKQSVWDYARSFFLLDWFFGQGRVLGVTWTLAIEIGFYIITALVIVIDRKNPARGTWVAIGIWLMVNLIIFGLFPNHQTDIHHPVFIGVLLGGRILYLRLSEKVSTHDSLLQAGFLAITYFLLHTSAFPNELLGNGFSVLAEHCMAFVLFAMVLRWNPAFTRPGPISTLTRPLAFLGNISYSLYLLHQFVGYIVIDQLVHIGVNFWVSVIAGVALSIILSWLSYRLVELKIQKLARVIIRRTSRQSKLTAAA